MELNEKQLIDICQKAAINNSTQTKECFDNETLFKAVIDELDEKNKFKIIDHIFICEFCASRFKSIKSFYNETESLIKEKKNIKLEPSEVKEIVKRGNEITGSQNSQKTITFPKFSLKYLSTAAALLFIIIGGMLVISPGKKLEQSNIVRGGQKISIQTLSPIGVIAASDLVFKWKPVKKAQEYQLKLYDDELTCIWTSPRIKISNIKPQSEIIQKIKLDKRYFWKVIVHFTNNKLAKSDIQNFKLKPKTK